MFLTLQRRLRFKDGSEQSLLAALLGWARAICVPAPGLKPKRSRQPAASQLHQITDHRLRRGREGECCFDLFCSFKGFSNPAVAIKIVEGQNNYRTGPVIKVMSTTFAVLRDQVMLNKAFQITSLSFCLREDIILICSLHYLERFISPVTAYTE